MSSSINLENFTLDKYIQDNKKKTRKGVPKKGVRRTGRQTGDRRISTRGGRGRIASRRERPERTRAPPSRPKLRVSNLPFNVTNQELYELFSQFGALNVCKLHFDKLGRSLGSANVEFREDKSARAAINEYNGAELDGKTISIEWSNAGGTLITRRIGGRSDRDRERDRDIRRRGRGSIRRDRDWDRREYRNGPRRGFNKRRFNDRIRDRRGYRDRR